MRKRKVRISVLVLLVSIASTIPAFAQSHKSKPADASGAAGPAPMTATPTATPAPVVSPTAGTEAPAVKIIKTVIVVADNWTITCTETDQPNAKERCSAELKIVQTEDKTSRVVFTWVLGAQDGKLLSVLSTPTGVLIAPGLQLKVGDKEIAKVGYTLCQPDRCQAIVPMDDTVIAALRDAVTSEVSIFATNGNGLKFNVNMKGFDKALAAVNK